LTASMSCTGIVHLASDACAALQLVQSVIQAGWRDAPRPLAGDAWRSPPRRRNG
jgi:hypothetical protein